MLGQVFPPENFAPCAIAGEGFTAARRARVVPASNRVFISVLRVAEGEFASVDPAAMISPTVTPRKTVTLFNLFNLRAPTDLALELLPGARCDR
jgi:hypothetical protein